MVFLNSFLFYLKHNKHSVMLLQSLRLTAQKKIFSSMLIIRNVWRHFCFNQHMGSSCPIGYLSFWISVEYIKYTGKVAFKNNITKILLGNIE